VAGRAPAARGPAKAIASVVRRIVPALPVLSRNAAIMAALDAGDRLIGALSGAGDGLPPNRYRIRTGVGSRLVGNRTQFRLQPVNSWIEAFACGYVTLSSHITELGSGCGRWPLTLRDYDEWGSRFEGHYTGIDVDPEMVAWCRANFPGDRFTFHRLDVRSTVYNPGGSSDDQARLPLADDSQDYVFSVSLLTHLLEPTLARYVAEAHRILKPGAWMRMTVFCIDLMALGGRWRLEHRLGNAYLESLRYPEAAVAYEDAFLRDLCARQGFADARIEPGEQQSMLAARKAGDRARPERRGTSEAGLG
jgi:SAM-dependent methyltransferase